MDNILRKEDILHNLIIFSLIWTFGGILEEKGRKKYELFINELFLKGKLNLQYNYDYGPYEDPRKIL